MIYNYFEFNNNLINSLAIVYKRKAPYIPEVDINTIDIGNRDGEVYNGLKYKPIILDISLYIEGDNVQDYCSRCAVLRDILICNEPVPISLVEGTLMYGILTTPFTVEQKTKKSGYSDLSFKIYTPYTYSNYLLPFSGSNNITVINSGQLPVKPFVSVTVGSNCHFVQLQNKLTGETVLVGKYPTLGIDTSAPARKLVYSNTCQSMLNINSGVSNIYSDRSTNGTLAVSSTGKGIILASLGSGDTAWKGAAGKINIGTNLDEFLISINLTHSSTGKNGDPNIFEAEKEYQDIQVVEGKKEEYYEITATSVNVRSGPGTSYTILGKVSKGYKVKNYTLTNGTWLKFTYNGKTAYITNQYAKKMVSDGTRIVTKQFVVENMWLNHPGSDKTVNKGVVLRAEPNINSTSLCVIPHGTCVRVIKKLESTETGSDKRTYYKLAKAYNGKMGYLDTTYLKNANDMMGVSNVDYSDDPNYADDKLGTVEIYGFDVNGTRLFCGRLFDDNAWYEFTKPEVKVGSKTLLRYVGVEKAPKKISVSKNGVTELTNYLSGTQGDWNDFYGNMTIERTKSGNGYKWSTKVQKVSNGVVTIYQTGGSSDSSLPKEALSYLVIYIGGATTLNKLAGMSINDIYVYDISKSSSPGGDNIMYFNAGDTLDFDFENQDFYINEIQHNDLIDIGSRFFDISTGSTDITVTTNGTGVNTGVVIREKWLGAIDNIIVNKPNYID